MGKDLKTSCKQCTTERHHGIIPANANHCSMIEMDGFTSTETFETANILGCRHLIYNGLGVSSTHMLSFFSAA